MTQIQDSILQLVNAELANSTGTFTHNGDYNITGSLNADTIHVKNLITEAGNTANIGDWVVNAEAEIVGKGFSWTWGEGSVNLQYRADSRLWTNASLDLQADQSYKIDNIPVISASSLGDSIVHSKLKTIGTLSSLTVSGDATLGEFVYVNSMVNRLGIGTEDPSNSITILDNNVEIGIGSPDYNTAGIGTVSSHDFTINSDNQARITVRNSGEVEIGNPASKNGLLRVYGSLYVDNLIADTRVDRSSPLEFSATRDQSIYGLGIVWSGNGAQRELLMYSDPDRIRSSENFDLADGHSYFINGIPVLSSYNLGNSVAHSNLVTVGILQKLEVQGDTTLHGELNVEQNANFRNIVITDGTQNTIINNKGIGSFTAITVSSAGLEAVYADAREVNIGDRTNTARPVKVFGPLSVGIANPDPSLKFSVDGDVSVGGKRFTNGTAHPSSGSWNQGDICWNTAPLPNSYIGWTCVHSGNPGTWLGFGLIASQ